MGKIKILYCILAVLVGAFLFIYGGFDDSPGCQLLGLLVIIAGIVGLVKGRNKISRLK
ncbi:MAG: hypothetical protein WCV72_03035 [Patescibacteria group bacterium]